MISHHKKDNSNSTTLHDTSITITVCGKLILFGEHLVFYNSSVIGIPLPFTLKATFVYKEYKNEKKNTISKFDIISDYPIDTSFIDHIQKVCEEHYKKELPKSKVYIESTIPIGSGYGSSAALCVALAKGILHYHKNIPLNILQINTKNTQQQINDHTLEQQGISKQDIWHFAHHLEQFFHTPASGIDTALCTYQQAIMLSPHQVPQQNSRKKHSFAPPPITVHPLAVTSQIPHCLHIVSAVVIRKIPTKKLIAQVQKQLQQFHQLQTLQQLHTTVLHQLQSYYTLYSNHHTKIAPFDYHHFATTVNALQQKLCDIGLCTPTMQKAMQIAMKAGSIATKLSGAGGGGAFVCFCSTKQDAQNVYKALQHYAPVQSICIQAL